MHWTTFTAITLAAAALGSTPARAASPDYCAPTEDMDPLQLLRQTSLDLRGRVPSYDEYEWVRGAEDPQAAAESIIEDMLESQEYFDQIREYHQALLWGTMDESILDSLFAAQRRILPNGSGNWRVTNSRRLYRGDLLDCLNQEQTEFDAQGRPIPIQTYADPVCAGGTCRREGFVRVHPYWAPDTEIKVCAYDAQLAEVGVSGVACSTYRGNDRECGCGPDLAWCGPEDTGPETVAIRDSLAQEPARIFEWVVREGRSYLEAFTTDRTFVNGPVAHFYRNNTGTDIINRGGAVAYDVKMGSVPALPWTDLDTWVPVDREGPHSGAFTTMGYLVRFASNRSRANRFYTAFYCDPFVPSADGLPPEEAEPDPNLRERTGCSDCHQVLEPAAAHWARWRTGGTYGFFAAEDMSFQRSRPDCECGDALGVTCSAFCSTYFVTADNAGDEEFGRYHGMPQAASWLEPTDLANVEVGPAGLVDTVQERDQVAQCAVRNLAQHLLGRELEAEDLQWLQQHADAFAATDYDYTELVRRMVVDERYRTIR
ncbi:MAG: DUF1585 domain-containing protein [Myxococcales bacterium]|nr:DUF1585 domain-containing protein [Myxococcales bacterium]